MTDFVTLRSPKDGLPSLVKPTATAKQPQRRRPHASHVYQKQSSSFRLQPIRSSRVIAAARTEVQNGTHTNYKSAAFDDWFKAAFDTDEDGSSSAGKKNKNRSGANSLRTFNAKERLAQHQAEAANMKPRRQPRSKAISSLKSALPRFATGTTASKGGLKINPWDTTELPKRKGKKKRNSHRTKRIKSPERKRQGGKVNEKQRAPQKIHGPRQRDHRRCGKLSSDKGGGPQHAAECEKLGHMTDQGPASTLRQKYRSPKKPARACPGLFCKLFSGKRPEDEALILVPCQKRALIEYKMFRECRSIMTAFERSTMLEEVFVCQKCAGQYAKFTKAKGWERKANQSDDNDLGIAFIHQQTRRGFRTMRADLLDLKRHKQNGYRRQHVSKTLKSEDDNDSVRGAARRSHLRTQPRTAKISFAKNNDAMYRTYNHADGSHHRWRKMSTLPTQQRSDNDDSDNSDHHMRTFNLKCSRKNRLRTNSKHDCDTAASRRKVARKMAQKHGLQLFSPKHGSSDIGSDDDLGSPSFLRRSLREPHRDSRKDLDGDIQASKPIIHRLACELCDCQCYRPNHFLLNRCDVCAHSKSFHTIDLDKKPNKSPGNCGDSPQAAQAQQQLEEGSKEVQLALASKEEEEEEEAQRNHLLIKRRIAELEYAEMLRQREEAAERLSSKISIETDAGDPDGPLSDVSTCANDEELDLIKETNGDVTAKSTEPIEAKHSGLGGTDISTQLSPNTVDANIDENVSYTFDKNSKALALKDAKTDLSKTLERLALRNHEPSEKIKSLFERQEHIAQRMAALSAEPRLNNPSDIDLQLSFTHKDSNRGDIEENAKALAARWRSEVGQFLGKRHFASRLEAHAQAVESHHGPPVVETPSAKRWMQEVGRFLLRYSNRNDDSK